MTDIAKLLERVRAATGPDRELDRSLLLALVAEPIPAEGMVIDWLEECFPGRGHIYPVGKRTHHLAGTPTDGTTAPAYTASVDAALALVERKLPGWLVDHIGADGAGDQCQLKCFGWYCELTDGVENHAGDAPTLPLAILAALLSALSSGDAS